MFKLPPVYMFGERNTYPIWHDKGVRRVNKLRGAGGDREGRGRVGGTE